MSEKVRTLIIGSGPAGYTAAIYTARADIKPLLYQGIEPGGQLTTTTEVENFPGYPEGITGAEMMEDLRKQAERFGADIRFGTVTEIDLKSSPKKAIIDGEREVFADTIIIATGATAKYLGLPDEKKYMGQGVSACATCDGFFYRKKVVAVIGGGDTACEEALFLATLAEKVYLIVRRDVLRASKVVQERVNKNEKIEILYNHNATGLFGENGVEGVHLLKNNTDENYDLPIDGFFLAIGHSPNTKIFEGQLELDDIGYVVTKNGSPKTSIPGVFAAGDVADPVYRQAITAAGTGCQAALETERYLSENGL